MNRQTLYIPVLLVIAGFVLVGCQDNFVASNSETADGPEVQMRANAQNSPTVSTSASSLGKVVLDTEVSAWDIGSGNPNGEFITAENQGVVIGLRAMERFEGLLGVSGTQGNRIAVYEASTTSPGNTKNNGTWNYDFHVDLSDAKGRLADKTLADYQLVLEQDFTEQSLFGALGSDPVQLPLDAEPPAGSGVCSNDSFDADNLCQQSWNPGFGNDDYDPTEEDTYNLRLVLTPKTFNGQPLAVTIQVNVSDN